MNKDNETDKLNFNRIVSLKAEMAFFHRLFHRYFAQFKKCTKKQKNYTFKVSAGEKKKPKRPHQSKLI